METTVSSITTHLAESSERIYRTHVRAWAVYGWSLDGIITTTIVSFFPPYFIAIAMPAMLKTVSANLRLLGGMPTLLSPAFLETARAADSAANIFSLVIALALFAAAILAPVVGAYTDITGRRKRALILVTMLGSVVGSLMVLLTTGAWLLALVLYAGLQVAVNLALGMHSSLLPHVSKPDDLGRVSSLGYALAFVGGGILLAANTALYSFADRLGIQSDTAVRIAFLLAGIWWTLFALPLALAVPEPAAAPADHDAHALQDTLKMLSETLRNIRRYRELFKMLMAFWLYMEGVSAIILLGTAYGASLGLDTGALIGTILLTEFVGFAYVLIFGQIPDASSKWRSASVSMVLWTAVTLPMLGFYANQRGDVDIAATFILLLCDQAVGLLFSALIGRRLLAGFASRLDTKRAVLLGLAVFMIIPIWGFFLRTSAEFFMIGWLAGTVQGGVQALSRTIYASMSPKAKSGEFFGLYGLCDRFAGIIAPLVYGITGIVTHSPQASIFSVAVFFAAGIILLWRVDERQGALLADSENSAAESLAAENTSSAG